MEFTHPDYEVNGRLGAGGQAVVFRAIHRPLERPVAVKVLRSAGDDDLTERLLREARLVAKLRHPSVVQVFDVGRTAEGLPYVVMECVDGHTLTKRLKAGPIEPRQALLWGKQLAGALGAAHAAGIVHRDVKPSNVLLSSDPQRPAMLADFGVAHTEASELTEVGQAMGTPAYMAPECFTGEVSPRSDVYALGFMLYEMLAGRPFVGDSLPHWVHLHMACPVPSLPEELELPPRLHALVGRMLAKDPALRPADGSEVEIELQAILDGLGDTLAVPVVPAPAPPRRSWALPALVALSMAGALALIASLALGGGAWMAWSTTRPDPPTPVAAPVAPEPSPLAPPPAMDPPEAVPEAAPEPAPEALVPAPTPGAPAPAPPQPAPAPEAPAASPEAPGEGDAPPPAPAPPPVDPAPDEAPAATPTAPGGTWRGTAQGRPVTVELSGQGHDATAVVEVTMGARADRHPTHGTLLLEGGAWTLTTADAAGDWGLEATLVDGVLRGELQIKGRRVPLEARR